MGTGANLFAEAGSKVLVLNAGSSSIKFKVFSVAAGALTPGIGGVVERIGDVASSNLSAKGRLPSGETKKYEVKSPAKDHVSAVQTILNFLRDTVSSRIAAEVKAVGHRIVHGLEISQPVLLDGSAIEKIKRAAVLAPLHNPPGLQGIHAAQEVFSTVPQVAVFDTAFHQTMPPTAYMYGLPYDMYEKLAIRRYGFHGTSHQYLVDQAARMLGKPTDKVNLITCHLGNGSSVTAVKEGRSVDTSMGMTPLEGLLMGTRSGDVDPAVVLHIQNQLQLSTKDTDTLLNKKSGLLGICGHSDLRPVIDLAAKGDARASLALDMFVYRVRKYIGAYTVALDGRVDALVFSAGIGENSAFIRTLICRNLRGMGIELDEVRNNAAVGGRQDDVAVSAARVRTLVIPTDEELAIAQQAMQVVARVTST
mmetsp:Transcript_4480/g.9637  ORF Transcript_4480/g.9637 Transcript_4480/m.9637 type:complete len:421 (+) Transcript_4480:106-1368(+)|eukprot:CAMPEP_0202920938 /NCGR_PEP_ID=MMETSP1392-20130828/77123_1 /ASSEMBLY_ACC=CAM_ASM_000868 /TAXON_ID=225041 /ORGANISM="Chlamydomonas chlamydogama, Strain SAG 11-48b" /LENGTH=420 /DNA_ID=CAMNT_0049614463 /DNA_START=17 /DNA_END=1279 /DNA_ORIENTATION=+